MTGKNFYDILGVGRHASTAEIRAAFVLRSKVMHPDRFNQTTQAAEWKLANELLQDLNRANATLRDPVLRRQYDEQLFGKVAGPPPVPPQQAARPTAQKPRKTNTQKFNVPEDESPQPRPKSLWAPPVFKGGMLYGDVPQSVKLRLKQRSDNQLTDQLRVPFQTTSVAGNVILTGFSVFCLYQTAQPGSQPWTPSGYIGLLVWCALLGSFIGTALNGLIKWFSSPLKSWVIVTPLYLILMDYGQVFAWPLWEVKSIGSSGGKDKFPVVIQVGEKADKVTCTLPNAGAYTRFYNFVVEKQKRLHQARGNRETRFFDEVNDLVAATPTTRDVLRYAPPIPDKVVANLCIAIGIAVYAFAAWKSPAASPAPISPPSPEAPAPAVASALVPPAPPPGPTYPVQTPPPDGAVYTFSASGQSPYYDVQPQNIQEGQEPTYPFPVASTDPGGFRLEDRPIICPLTVNTPAGDNYLIKLIDVQTNQPVMSFYISASSSVTVKVPLGTYAIHCAFGSTWYGPNHLFGPSTGYSKLDDNFAFTESDNSISTETITLYPVTNGNLQTTPLPATDF